MHLPVSGNRTQERYKFFAMETMLAGEQDALDYMLAYNIKDL